jgi:hypothetical protein
MHPMLQTSAEEVVMHACRPLLTRSAKMEDVRCEMQSTIIQPDLFCGISKYDHVFTRIRT